VAIFYSSRIVIAIITYICTDFFVSLLLVGDIPSLQRRERGGSASKFISRVDIPLNLQSKHRGVKMSDKIYRVEIADATGHSVVEMTKTEISEKARSTEGTWVFVDDRLVSADEIANLEMADDASVRLMPGLVGGADEATITVEIADATGHSVVEMTKTELTEKATSSEGTWVFVDDRLVSADEIDNLDFSQASKVRLMPGLVGGF